jgi:hypothetical protein
MDVLTAGLALFVLKQMRAAYLGAQAAFALGEVGAGDASSAGELPAWLRMSAAIFCAVRLAARAA